VTAGPAVVVDGLRFGYPGSSRAVLDGMGFTVRRGEVFGFLGPSGAGKTTTQHAILGLVTGWQGRIEVLGRDRGDWGRELFDRIGVAFERPAGYPRLTGREDLAHFANLHRTTPRDLDDLLATVGLAAAAGLPVGTYSKGMRVRLNLARALLHQPELLFLDEPTAGLDPVNAEVVRDLIREEQRRGRTVFLTTHDMVTADQVCDRVAFVVDGRIVACDDPRTLRLQHADHQVRVEYRTAAGAVRSTTFPVADAPDELATISRAGSVETIHTTEASLADVFARVTGRALT
jgi:fluoroquinolone transport system ATP-binding protein